MCGLDIRTMSWSRRYTNTRVLLLTFLTLLSVVRWSHSQQDATLHYEVMEEAREGTRIADVFEDAELAANNPASVIEALSFRFLNDPEWDFHIDPRTGIISTSARLDRDTLCASEPRCQTGLDVVAMTSNPTRLIEMIKVTVEILDLNDNSPVFPESHVTFQLLESASVGTGLSLQQAVDPDAGQHGVQEYRLMAIDSGIRAREQPFDLQVTDSLGSTNVRLVLQRPLDRENERSYNLKIIARDGGRPRKTGSVDVTVQILDENDNDPVFDNTTYNATVAENIPINTNILRVRARDPDSGHYGTVVYRLTERSHIQYGQIFGVRNTTGDIYTTGVLDRERLPLYTLYVQAGDLGPDSFPADATVTIYILDQNDNAPGIIVNTLSSTSTDRADITEDVPLDTFVAHMVVSDPDSGRNAEFNCTLNDDTFMLKWSLSDDEQESLRPVRPGSSALQYVSGSKQYTIVTRRPLDRETKQRYSLAITCRDRGEATQIAIKHIQIMVGDVNDNAPVFGSDIYSSRIEENSYMGMSIVTVNATDVDMGANGRVRYSLHSEAEQLFEINQLTGEVVSRAVFDYERSAEVRFRVIATDMGVPPLSSTAMVVLQIMDVNDEVPVFSDPGGYTFGVAENLPRGTQVGYVSAHDSDGPEFSEVAYTLLPSHTALNVFSVDEESGRLSTRVVLDREVNPVYYLQVEARDNGIPTPHSSTTTVTVYVTDVNDNPPEFDFPSRLNNTVHVSSKTPRGHPIAKLHAHDLDMGSNANLTYKHQNSKHQLFRIDPRSGVITVQSDLSDIEYQSFQLDVVASDGGKPSESVYASLNIVVNRSIPFTFEHSAILAGHNFTIVVSLGCLTGVIVVILIIAIVLIKRQDNDKKGRNYNCRMQALKALHTGSNGTGDPVPPDEDSTGVVVEVATSGDGGMGSPAITTKTNGTCIYDKPALHQPNGDKPHPVKEVSFNLDHENNSLPEYSSCMVPTSGCLKNAMYTPSAHIAALEASPPHHRGSSGSTQPNGSTTKPWSLTQKELEVHQLLEMLRQDPDADSAYSGESSNTDSGRGLSEEGEGLAGNHHHNNHQHHQHHHHTLPHHAGSNDRVNAQNLPAPPPPHSLSDPNLAAGPRSQQRVTSSPSSAAAPNSTSGTSPYHSYSNQPTPSFHTFSPSHGAQHIGPHGGPQSGDAGGYHRTNAHANYGQNDAPTSGGYNPRSVSSLPTPPPPCTRGGGYYGARSTDSSSGVAPQRGRSGPRQPHVPASIPEESVIASNGHCGTSNGRPHSSPVSQSPYNSKVRLKGTTSNDIVV